MKRQKIWLLILIGIIFSHLYWLVLPEVATALPAWSRKYNADCSLCHSPAVPRLNKRGQQFRWAGYRMSDEFDQAQDISNVGHFLSLRGRGRARYQAKENAGDVNRFEWHDTTFFYAGALSENISSFTELEWEGQDEVKVVAQIRALFGKPRHFTTIRFGQFHPIQGVGIGGFDRPTGISRPEPLSSRGLTSSGIPFRIRENQKGVEVAHVVGNTRILAQVLNGLVIGGKSGIEGTEDRDKDFLFAYEHILDELASGFTLYGYRGVWHDGALPNDYRFYRYGMVANKIFSSGTEIIGGYFRSEDKVPTATGSDVEGNSFYVELQQFLKGTETTLLARLDWIDPNDGASKDVRQKEMIGAVHSFQRHLRLALEINRSTDDAKGTTDYQALAEAMINF